MAIDDRFGPVSQAQVRKIMMGEEDFEPGDLVQVEIAGLSRPLFGKVIGPSIEPTRLKVEVAKPGGESTANIDVDKSLVKRWRP